MNIIAVQPGDVDAPVGFAVEPDKGFDKLVAVCVNCEDVILFNINVWECSSCKTVFKPRSIWGSTNYCFLDHDPKLIANWVSIWLNVADDEVEVSITADVI